MKFRTFCAATLAFAVSATTAMAAGVPAGAMNKTVTVSFTATGNYKGTDGRTGAFNTHVTRTIYISSAGRLFMKHEATNRTGSRGGEFDPNDARRGKGSFQFQGNRLVGVIPYAAGARQITVSFDGGFSSCTASVIEGHSGGVIKRKGPNGAEYEITRGSTTAPSCSIQSGNAFGG
jgi:hypothetical protein